MLQSAACAESVDVLTSSLFFFRFAHDAETKLLLETNYLPNEFTIDAFITFEDQFNAYFLGADRLSYPYDCYPIKIAPDPNRNNQLDIAIDCLSGILQRPVTEVKFSDELMWVSFGTIVWMLMKQKKKIIIRNDMHRLSTFIYSFAWLFDSGRLRTQRKFASPIMPYATSSSHGGFAL